MSLLGRLDTSHIARVPRSGLPDQICKGSLARVRSTSIVKPATHVLRKAHRRHRCVRARTCSEAPFARHDLQPHGLPCTHQISSDPGVCRIYDLMATVMEFHSP